MDAIIRNQRGQRLAYSFVPAAGEGRELIVIGHGLTSDKERPWSEALSRGLAARGIASLRLAFSGNGASEGDFLDSTISQEVRDLRAVFDACEGRRIGYVGHSMGAAVGLLAASSDARIGALVSLAGMVHTQDFVQRHFAELQPGELMLGKPGCPLGASFLDDMRAIGTVAGLAARIAVPWLIVHGEADEVVLPRDAEDAYAAAGGRAELVRLPGVDHSFSGAGLEAMTSVVVPWLAARCAARG